MATVSTTSHTSAQPAGADPAQQIMQMASGYMMSAALHTVVKLGVADHLADGPLAIGELAARTGSNADALYRMLRPLIAIGVFAETAPKTIALADVSQLLRADHPRSMRDTLLWVTSPFHFTVWAEMESAVRTGEPAIELLYHKPCFEVFQEKPEVSATFNAAMTAMSARIAPALIEAYDFGSIGTLMDVAGGHGFVLCEVLRAYPKLQGILFDMESVIAGAKCRVCDLKMDQRCQTIAGDFFQEIPAGADAYYLQHIIHDWPDEKALSILNNCRRALQGRKDGRLLIVESILSEKPAPHFGNLLDLEMLLMPGGRERTESEYRQLLSRAGFEISRIVPMMKAPESVMEARLK
jgi:hypothetical protein